MKKYLVVILIVLAVLAGAVVFAKAADSEAALEGVTEIEAGSELFAESETVTEAVSEVATENATEQIPEDTVPGGVIFPDSEGETVEIVDFGEVKDIIDSSESLSEAILKVAERFGISIEKAEQLVNDVKALGDKYLGDSEIWQMLGADIAAHPARYTLIAVIVLAFVSLFVFVIRRIISDMMQIRAIKMTNTQIKEALVGGGEDGEAESLKALMVAKNKEVDALKGEVAELRESVLSVEALFGEVNKSIDSLSDTVKSTKADTAKAADVSLEMGLQLTELINIALDRKIPLVSSEARKMWYDHSREKLIERAGAHDTAENGGEASAEAGKTV